MSAFFSPPFSLPISFQLESHCDGCGAQTEVGSSAAVYTRAAEPGGGGGGTIDMSTKSGKPEDDDDGDDGDDGDDDDDDDDDDDFSRHPAQEENRRSVMRQSREKKQGKQDMMIKPKSI